MQRDTRVSNAQEVNIEDVKSSETWPHKLNPALACLGCTLGLLNIDRFALLSIQYGVNFVLQFLIMSFILGIPILTLQLCLGQKLKTGILNMWKISPLFQGVGVALLSVQACIGIYSVIGVSWMFVYLRDSFISKQETYRWSEDFKSTKIDANILKNDTLGKLPESIPNYLNRIVLRRQNLIEQHSTATTLKFQVAFNLAVVWMIVFISLSKGLKSYGKSIYLHTLIPILGNLVLCTKVFFLIPKSSPHREYSNNSRNDFFVNGQSWIAASSEAFLTWGLLGAAAMQIAAHNKHEKSFKKNTALAIVLTLVVLLMNAFIATSCVKILGNHGYTFTATSFEKIPRSLHHQSTPGYTGTNAKLSSRASFLLGQRIIQSDTNKMKESGYQVLRFSTELLPSTIALLGAERFAPFWSILFYSTLICFGIAQQLAIWYCVIMGLLSMNASGKIIWDTRITFFSCACAYILGLPMATELGIYIIYYLDYVIGSGWWIMILYLIQFGVVFAVRRRPHFGEFIIAELFSSTDECFEYWARSALSFIWRIILPITLGILSIVVFESGGSRELYSSQEINEYHWTIWARKMGITIQLVPLLIIPGVAVVQASRYLCGGSSNFFDKMQLLCRPPLEFTCPQNAQYLRNGTTSNSRESEVLRCTAELTCDDSPPKYTPPPSYTTATGARIAKILRQSYRRSVRRLGSILGENHILESKPTLLQPPPEYRL